MTASTSRNRARNTVGQAPGIAGSLALHVAIVAAVMIAWMQSRSLPNDAPSTAIPVEMVDVADITNIRAESREEPKPLDQPPEELAPAPAPDLPKPEAVPPPPQDEPPPPPEETVAADEPLPPPPVQKPAPPVQKPAPPVQKPAPPVQKPQSAPPKPNRANDLDRILNSVLADNRPQQQQRAPAAAPRGQHNQRGIGQMNAATADIETAFKQQMRECWNFPAGAPHPEELVVEVRVQLSRDGHLVGNPELSAFTRAAMARNTYMQAAADAALRALSVCQPYNLPPDRYAQWSDLTLTFDPKSMAGL